MIDLNNYKNCRNSANNMIKYQKKKHYENTFKENINNIKGTWHNIKLLINEKKKVKNPPIILNNDILYDSKIIANAFNDYFINLFNKPSTIDPSFKNFLKTANSNSFFLDYTDSNEILHFAKTLSNSKSRDSHLISNKTLKIIIESTIHL